MIASVSRILARNLFPSPSPLLAPFTSPAMSTISTVVGTIRWGCTSSASAFRRSSGTVITPTFGSIVQKQAQTGGDKAAKQAYDVLVQYKDALEHGKSARTVTFETKDEQKIAHELFLLTSKPVMYVCNVDEASAVNGNKYVDMVRDAVKDENAQILIVAAKTKQTSPNWKHTKTVRCSLPK